MGWTEEEWDAFQKRRQQAQRGPGVAISSPLASGAGQTGKTLTVTAYVNDTRPSKYGAVAVRIDDVRFASRKEGRRYEALKLLERVGAIRDLVCHPSFDLYAGNGERVGRFTADFQYHSLELGRIVVEDVKGGTATRTEAYQLRKKLFIACYGPILLET